MEDTKWAKWWQGPEAEAQEGFQKEVTLEQGLKGGKKQPLKAQSKSILQIGDVLEDRGGRGVHSQSREGTLRWFHQE